MVMENLTDGEIKTHLVRGGFWVFLVRVTEKGLGFVKLIILANLLVPRDFGLLGIALLAVSTLEIFTRTGFEDALIQQRRDIKPYLDTAWTFLVGRGLVLYLAVFLLAPLIAGFFQSPASVLIIQVLGLSVIVKSLTNIRVLGFLKDLDFRRHFWYITFGSVVEFLVTVTLAVVLRNVWALVIGSIAAHLCRLAASYFLCRVRPRMAFSVQKARELFRYGKWVTGSSVLSFLITQGDDIVVGKLLGTLSLGFYQMAYRISNLPATEITQVLSRVSFPLYSRLQSDPRRLRDSYLRLLKVTVFLSFPVALFFLSSAGLFTSVFLGEKWHSIIPVIRILSLWGLIRSVGATTGAVFKATGRPDLLTKIHLAKLSLLILLIFPLVWQWGLLGAALAVTLNGLIINPLAAWLTLRQLQIEPRRYVRILVLPALAALGMTGGILLLTTLLSHLPALLLMTAVILAAAVLYAAGYQLFRKVFGDPVTAINFREFRSTLNRGKGS